jgi:hypothetical protein
LERYFLGIEVARNSRGMALSQLQYVLELLEETGRKLLSKTFHSTIPVEPQGRLSEKDDPLFEDKGRYRSIVGKLLYVTVTRPDISFAVNRASQFMENPRYSHWQAVCLILRYLKGSTAQERGSTFIIMGTLTCMPIMMQIMQSLWMTGDLPLDTPPFLVEIW